MAVDRIGHAFVDQGLLAQALTHRSAGAPHNERLEFLGDGVVNLLIAEALFQRWPKADEGAMTRARAELVREASLATIARTEANQVAIYAVHVRTPEGAWKRYQMALLKAPARVTRRATRLPITISPASEYSAASVEPV